MHRLENGSGIADIEAILMDIETKQVPVIGRRGGRQRHAGDPRPQALQPEREPAALETGVAGEEDAAVAIDLVERHDSQTFHGALPPTHSSSNWILSRKVSIGSQKPACL